jgi:hypothetical protein
MFSTRFTTARDFDTDWLRRWQHVFGLDRRRHRKWWEIATVCETLDSHQVLAPGKTGVGFGVGSDPLVKYFAERGADILATDLLDPAWIGTHHNFDGLQDLPRVQTARVDMNWLAGHVPTAAADFCWSVCAMDHVGTIWWLKRFVLNQMNCLRPGGIAVHTAEYTISHGLPRAGGTVWLEAADLLDLASLAGGLGYEMAPIDWFIGDRLEDHLIDDTGTADVHIKAGVAGRWGTCVAIALCKLHAGEFWVDLDEATARRAISVVPPGLDVRRLSEAVEVREPSKFP